MTSTKIQTLILRCIEIEKQKSDLETELKAHKLALTTEAEGRHEEHTPTEGGGWSWTHPDPIGNIVRVTQPAPKLKGVINGESKAMVDIRFQAGKAFHYLFDQVPAYKPVADFRDKAVAHLGRDAKRLIKLVTTESATQVAFEVKEPA